MSKTKARKLAELLGDSSAIGSSQIEDGSITSAEIANDAVTSAKVADNAVGAAALDVSGNGTAGQALLSDGDGSMSWGEAGKSFLGTTIEVSTKVTLTADDDQKLLLIKAGGGVALPALQEGLTFGFINEAGAQTALIANSSSDPIDEYTGSVYIADGQEGFITCTGTAWKLILVDSISTVAVTQLSTGTYTPPSYVSSFLIFAVGGGSYKSSYQGGGGGGYSEKFVSSPSGSYTVVVGGPSGASSVNGAGCAITANGASGITPGNGSGGSHNASGGTGVGSTSRNSNWGGGASAGSRAGDGYSGGQAGGGGPSSGGAGGGTGGPGSGTTPGIAANVAANNASSTVAVHEDFRAGGNLGFYRAGNGAHAGLGNIQGGGGEGAHAESGPSNNPSGVVGVVEFLS